MDVPVKLPEVKSNPKDIFKKKILHFTSFAKNIGTYANNNWQLQCIY